VVGAGKPGSRGLASNLPKKTAFGVENVINRIEVRR